MADSLTRVVSDLLTATSLSLLFTLLSGLALAWIGLFDLGLRVFVALTTATAGLMLGLTRGYQPLRGALVAAGLFLALVFLMLGLPQRSEWIVGGWDPGTYVAQGVMIAETGRLFPEADPFYSQLEHDEIDLFTYHEWNFTEAYRVVALDRESRGLESFFFPGTNLLTASLYAAGGLRAATRCNHFLGLLSLGLFLSVLLKTRQGNTFDLSEAPEVAGPAFLCRPKKIEQRNLPWLAGLLLILQPIWIAHWSMPTTEMMQLCVICGLGFLLVYHTRFDSGQDASSAAASRIDGSVGASPSHVKSSGSRESVGALFLPASLLFLGTINRVDFFLFGAMWLCALNFSRCLSLNFRPLSISATAWLATTLLGGLAIDLLASPSTVDRLGDSVRWIASAGIGFLALAFLPTCLPAIVTGLRPLTGRLGAALYCLIIFIVIFILLQIDDFWKYRDTFQLQARVSPQYLGSNWLILCLPGLLLALWRGLPLVLGWWLFWLGAISLAVVLFADIAMLWPWMTRRYVPSVLPLIAVLAALPLLELIRLPCGKILSNLVVLLLFIPSAKVWWGAARQPDYAGVGAQLQAVADRISDRDLIVADHFVWAVPLRLVHGKTVINGERLWNNPDPERTRRAMQVLHRFQLNGWRIRFLTSTEKTPADLYLDGVTNVVQRVDASRFREAEGHLRSSTDPIGGPMQDLEVDWEGEPFAYEITRHEAPPVRGYERLPRQKQFRLISRPKVGYSFATLRPPGNSSRCWTLDLGTQEARKFLGRGWSRPEGDWRHNIAWVKRREADVYFPVRVSGPHELAIVAAPLPDMRLRQSFGAYVNDVHLETWLCPTNQIQRIYSTTIPEDALQVGTNRLTLRVGHLEPAPGNDTRELGIQLDGIWIEEPIECKP